VSATGKDPKTMTEREKRLDRLRSVDLNEAAEILRMDEGTLYNWCQEEPPRIPFYRNGRNIRFRIVDLEQHQERNRVEAGWKA
jgi:excisionase family DNA binding protein